MLRRRPNSKRSLPLQNPRSRRSSKLPKKISLLLRSKRKARRPKLRPRQTLIRRKEHGPGGDAVVVVGDVAVSFILLIGAGLMIRSFLKIERQNPGFDPTRLLSMRVSLPASSHGEFQKRLTEITRKMRTLPGVEAAALISNAPFSKTNVTFGPGGDEFEIEGD